MMNGTSRDGTYKAKVFKRETVVLMLQAALEHSEYRFARQIALAWLSAYPGDMEVTLLQARSVISEGRPSQVIPALELVCRKDPLFIEAYRIMAWASRDVDEKRYLKAKTSAFVLGDRLPEGTPLDEWAKALRDAYDAFKTGQYADALVQVEDILMLYPGLLLAQVIKILAARQIQTPAEVAEIAESFYAQWPDCLPISLTLAEAYLELGKEQEAVRLLHLGAAGDTMGHVARCMWGENHAYRSLWSDDLVILFDQPVPAGVAGYLGWNRLAPGEPLSQVDAPANEAPEEPIESATATEPEQAPASEPEFDPFTEVLEAFKKQIAPTSDKSETEPEVYVPVEDQTEHLAVPVEPFSQPEQVTEVSSEAETPVNKVDTPVHPQKDEQAEAVIKKVERELDGLAKKLKQASLARSDGRYPVYVILSSREGLDQQYGPQTASVIDGELRRLASIVGKRRGWQSILFYPDYAGSASQFGLDPVFAGDPWKVKHALADLDRALEKRGEMIGALLIVGGDRVLPFHRLPNPAEDSDEIIISDSPYATLDANYFVPEWPVGRLPGEKGSDAGALLEQIRQVQRFHSKQKKPFGLGWIRWLENFLERFSLNKTYPSFGYTAAVWRRSSLAVFRPIGAPHTVMTSPPAASGKLNVRKLTNSNLGYYNLHGLEDSAAWYGQRDPMEKAGSPEYPVALSPEDLHKNGRSPVFIFSEACYGGHVFGKSEKESLALKFLAMGAFGVVASTCISYGSIETPLIAADLLGHIFWQQLKLGHTVGEALTQAKVGLVREMHKRQGYLDGEDQKTLISFLLYGDPLAAYDGFHALNKATHRYKDHPMVKTILEENQEILSPSKVPSEVLKSVKQVVEEYLPGADVAGIHFCRLHLNREGSAAVPSSSKGQKSSSGRMVVTVSKQVADAQYMHRHFLKLTVDDAGQTIKVALSR